MDVLTYFFQASAKRTYFMFLFVNCISCVSYIGRWILYHCATWEAIILDYKYKQCDIYHSLSELLHSV